MVPQTMPYQGSKRRLSRVILAHCPGLIRRVVEPFAGSAAISIHAVRNGRAETVWLNDAHKPLIRLWAEIINNPHELAESYSALWHEQLGQEREFYDLVRARFNERSSPVDFLYLLARCVKAAVRFNHEGKFNNSPDNRRLGAKPDLMRRRIMQASSILEGRATLTATDYTDVLGQCTTDDLVYMDPPYQGTCQARDKRYHGDFSHDEFCESLAGLVDRGVPFILSYDGITGNKRYGSAMPDELGLKRILVDAGRSTQSTLLGGTATTYESIYISPDVRSNGLSF